MPRPTMTAAFAASASDDKREFTVEIRETRSYKVKMTKSDLRALFEGEFFDGAGVPQADERKIDQELDMVMWQLAERKTPIVYTTRVFDMDMDITELFNSWQDEVKEKIESSYKSLKGLLDRVRGR